ncbi:unnamed protein product, partial [Closterium sp. NIES-53]
AALLTKFVENVGRWRPDREPEGTAGHGRIVEGHATTGPPVGLASETGTGAASGVSVVQSRKKQRDAPESTSTGLPPPLLCPPPDKSQPPLQLASPLPAPSSYTEQIGGLTERREPASRPAPPVRTSRRVPRPHPPPIPSTHAMALRPSSVPLHVPLLPPPESSLPAVPDPESDCARAASPIVSCLLATVVTDPSFKSTVASALVAELLEFATA